MDRRHFILALSAGAALLGAAPARLIDHYRETSGR
jgi:hypothetical protein